MDDIMLHILDKEKRKNNVNKLNVFKENVLKSKI